jgi:small-conductance mechanosensitive channel
MFNQIKDEFNSQFTDFYDSFISILPEIIMAIIVLLVFWLLARITKRLIKNRLSLLLKDPVLTGFMSRVFQYLLLIIAFAISLNILGLDALVVGIFSGAGVIAIIIGFAFKDIGENFIAGIILAFNRPFKKGDLIMLDDQKGRVDKMTIRETQIKTFDGKDVFIPNASILKGNLTNYTVDGFLRYEIELAIEEGSDIRKCFHIIIETLHQINGILEFPEPNVIVNGFGSSSLIIQYNFWVDIFNESLPRFQVRSKAHLHVWEALTKAGINLPGDVLELKAFSENEFPIVDRSGNEQN